MRTSSPNQLYRFSDLSWRIFARNIRSAHRKSLLGLAWLIIPALVNTSIWVFLHANGILKYNGDQTVSYVVFALTGIMFWQIFLDALQIPLTLMEKFQEIIKNLNFEHLSLMGASILETAFNVMVRLVLLSLFLFLFKAEFYWTAFLALYPLFVLLVLGFAVSMCLLPFYLMYRDVPRMMGYVTQFAFFVTPIIYDLPKLGFYAKWSFLNPVTPPLVLARDLIVKGQSDQWFVSSMILVFAVILFLIGIKIFKVTCLRMVERI